jgi:hypothetical protein
VSSAGNVPGEKKALLHCTLPETRPLPRARFCAESQIPSSRHRDDLPRAKGSALGTEKTRGTEFLCREGTVPPLGTGAYSRHRGSVPRAAEAGPRHSRHLTAQRNGRHGRLPGRRMCREPILLTHTSIPSTQFFTHFPNISHFHF